MRENLTEMIFILDRSGSMSGLEKDTIGGYNSLLEQQKNYSGEGVVSTILFDDKYELLHDRVNIKDVAPITQKDYFVRGSTALLDAIGKTIDSIGRALSDTAEENRPSKVIFVITTDGHENASHEYNAKKIKEMVERQRTEYSWEFLFLGANIDAIATAEDFGIDASRAVTFCNDKIGIKLSNNAVSAAVSRMRKGTDFDKSWKDDIELDFDKRGKKGGAGGGKI